MEPDTQHTPGPWTIKQHHAASRYGSDAWTLWPQGSVCDSLSVPDACLISAAPDLLAALEALIDLADPDATADHDHDQGFGAPHPEETCALCMARAAIAKAKGNP